MQGWFLKLPLTIRAIIWCFPNSLSNYMLLASWVVCSLQYWWLISSIPFCVSRNFESSEIDKFVKLKLRSWQNCFRWPKNVLYCFHAFSGHKLMIDSSIIIAPSTKQASSKKFLWSGYSVEGLLGRYNFVLL